METKLMKAALITACAVVGCDASAQTTPLPAALSSDFAWVDTFAGTLYLDGGGEQPYADMMFVTDEQVLEFMWTFGASTPGSETFTHHDSLPLGYMPTALCKESGGGNVVYVAGYSERASTSVIEKWTVTALVSQTVGPSSETLVDITPNYARDIVWTSPSAGPIRSLSFHEPSGCLWYQQEAAPHRLIALDPDDASQTVIGDANTVPNLSHVFYMQTFRVDAGPPGVVGFYTVCYPTRAWDIDQILDAEVTGPFVVFHDADFDGDIETQHHDWQFGDLMGAGIFQHMNVYY